MKNTKKGFTTKLIIISIIIISALYFIFAVLIPGIDESRVQKQRKESYDRYISTRPELTQQQAQTLAVRTWGDCTSERCIKLIVTAEEKSDIWYVIATYEGLMDDSISAERKEAVATYSGGVWTLGNASTTHKCQPNRGHQDFSPELCV